MSKTTGIRLGLIGDNIMESRAPALHEFGGKLAGLDIQYDLFIPRQMGMSFDEVFEQCCDTGLTGINVTLPYKERVVPKLSVEDPEIARIGACNTVLFAPGGPFGFNTDFSGFISAFTIRYGEASPGRVVMFGAGGVGKAVAFALKRLGAEEIICIDTDEEKAVALADAVNSGVQGRGLARSGGLGDLASADGVVNCTPLGMVGYGGTPVPDDAFPPCRWAFDAVYTPSHTPFRAQADSAGASFLSGYELYYQQGVDAFELFTGQPVSEHTTLRQMLAAPAKRLERPSTPRS